MYLNNLEAQLNVILRQYLPHTQELLKDYYKFVPRIQPSILGFANSNFGKDIQVSCVSKKDEREEVEKKLPNEYEPLFIPKRL